MALCQYSEVTALCQRTYGVTLDLDRKMQINSHLRNAGNETTIIILTFRNVVNITNKMKTAVNVVKITEIITKPYFTSIIDIINVILRSIKFLLCYKRNNRNNHKCPTRVNNSNNNTN